MKVEAIVRADGSLVEAREGDGGWSKADLGVGRLVRLDVKPDDLRDWRVGRKRLNHGGKALVRNPRWQPDDVPED